MPRYKYGTYHCDECDLTFKSFRELDGPMPDCPICVPDNTPFEAKAPALLTNKAKAIDIAQKVAEESFGLTDMNDNNRPGDIVAKGPAPIQTAEAEAITREMIQAGMGTPEVGPELKQYVEGFFGAATPQSLAAQAQQAAQQAAPQAAAETRAMGLDPIALLHKSKGGHGGINKIVPINKPKATT
jgi:hypothetical protein